MMNKAKDFAVNVVNAKLRSFNKPFLLASLIGFFQLAIIIAIAIMLKSSEYEVITISVGGSIGMLKKLSELEQPCIRNAQATNQENELFPCFFESVDDINWCNPEYFAAENDKLKSEKPRFECGGAPCVRCPFSPSSQCIEKVNDLGPDDEGKCVALHGARIERTARTNGVTALTYEHYPGWLAIWGMALGYAGFVEFFLTVSFVGCLWSCGIINTNDSPLKQWMKELIQENSSMVKEVGSDVQGRVVGAVSASDPA